MKIAPSILASDFSRLAEELKDIEKGGADYVHLDVMDGHFVPNLSFGVPIIKALRPCTNLPFDVHLMTYHPEEYLDDLEKAGTHMVSFHVEAVPHLDRMIHNIKDRGMKAGIALNPGTSLASIDQVLPLLDFVLIMSVNPGFGGQKFIPYSLDKIAALSAMIKERGLTIPIEVDGGVNKDNAPLLKKAGAEILVAGSSVFGKEDRAAAIRDLKV
ncbi:ribulose-phosphate 3-epimerase [uncultured Dialister sp.]|jgi:ribulose-phosphate 3-epimerase|uniref:ribulose-phosphate 3-epimerase n=1 Tax=uncultured Dialister sp. TaxID=278064 RepID=UPI0025DA7DC8|nr:ribulose-phosphate 3-epimerase [uncultured Dialister sp.]